MSLKLYFTKIFGLGIAGFKAYLSLCFLKLLPQINWNSLRKDDKNFVGHGPKKVLKNHKILKQNYFLKNLNKLLKIPSSKDVIVFSSRN